MENVSFNYDGKIIFENLNLELQTGVYWLQGANGTGKSTLLKLLSNTIKPMGGNIFYFRENINRLKLIDRQRIFLCEDELPELPWLKGYEFFYLYECVYGSTRRSMFFECLKNFKLTDEILNQSVLNLSLGQKKKLYLATAFSAGCDLILLDEPFNGLDSESMEFLRGLIINYAKTPGKLILFTSHANPMIEVKSLELIGGVGSKIIRGGR